MLEMSFYKGTLDRAKARELDITETDNEILLNTFSSNDML